MNTIVTSELHDGYAEFFGAMVSGKSYLYRAILRDVGVSSGKEFYYKEVFLRGIRWRRPLNSVLEMTIYLFSKNRSWCFNYKKHIEEGGWDLANARVLFESVHAYAHHFEADEVAINKRWESLYKAYCQHSVIVSNPVTDRIFLVDECIVQRCLSFAIMLKEPENFVAEYIKVAPCPRRVIFVTVDNNVSSSRISMRKRKHSTLEQERALYNQWIILAELKKKVLESFKSEAMPQLLKTYS